MNNKIQALSVAYILTKYQYHILLASLEKLQIDKSLVVIIIAKKAQKQGVEGRGFAKTLFYDDGNESIKYWFGLKSSIDALLQEIGFVPGNIFLRNFNATISRVLMSRYTDATLYLLEEGMPAYTKGNFMGYPLGIKEKIKTFITRMYFSKGLLRILPVNLKKTIKVGLFDNMKPWLDVPFLPVKLSPETLSISSTETSSDDYRVDVMIIDQPLWQVGLTTQEYKEMYIRIFDYLRQQHFGNVKIGIKIHPSTDRNELAAMIRDIGYDKVVHIFDGKETIEELLLSGQLEATKIFIGFFSWALCLIQAHRQNHDVQVIGFMSEKLGNKVKEAYAVMESMGIMIKK